jgi:hypothetical protein
MSLLVSEWFDFLSLCLELIISIQLFDKCNGNLSLTILPSISSMCGLTFDVLCFGINLFSDTYVEGALLVTVPVT